jgi:hypothetical protein
VLNSLAPASRRFEWPRETYQANLP